MPKYPEIVVKKSEFVEGNSTSVVGILIFHLRRYMRDQKWSYKKLDVEISNFVRGTQNLNFEDCVEYARGWVTIVD